MFRKASLMTIKTTTKYLVIRHPLKLHNLETSSPTITDQNIATPVTE